MGIPGHYLYLEAQQIKMKEGIFMKSNRITNGEKVSGVERKCSECIYFGYDDQNENDAWYVQCNLTDSERYNENQCPMFFEKKQAIKILESNRGR